MNEITGNGKLMQQVLQDLFHPRIDTSDGHFEERDGRCVMETSGGIFEVQGIRSVISLLQRKHDQISLRVGLENADREDNRISYVSPLAHVGDWSAQGDFTVDASALACSYPLERAYGGEGPHRIGDNRRFESYWFLSMHDPKQKTNFFIGVSDVPNGIVRFDCLPIQSHTDGKRVLQWRCVIDCRSGVNGVLIPHGSSLHLCTLEMRRWDGDHFSGLRSFAEEHLAPLRRRRFNTAAGWCSWYAGYATNITEVECVKNLEALAAHREISYFVIDDGWTEGAGTRDLSSPLADKAKFPRGMESIAQEIASRGKVPGLWLRPFQAWESDDAPEWAKQESLDLSNPDAVEWLESLARHIASWGFRFIKLDFLTYDLYHRWGMQFEPKTAVKCKPVDAAQTNVMMYRRALEAIRRGAGDDVFILGCNAMLLPSLGIVDAMRVGDDVSAENWDRTVTMGARAVAPMQFLNRTAWLNDPDCVVLHEPMTIARARSWATLVSIAGGAAIVSSKIFELDEARQRILTSTVPPSNDVFIPHDYPQHNPPRLWRSACAQTDGSYLLAAFNWSQERLMQTIDLAEIISNHSHAHVHEFWSRSYLGVSSGAFDVALDADSCAVLKVTPCRSHPTIIGTTSHLLQGEVEWKAARWDQHARAIEINDIARQNFDVFIAMPAGWRALCPAETTNVNDYEIARIHIGVERSVRWEFECE